MAQQQVVLPYALLDPLEQLIVLLYQRLHQRPVIRRQLWQNQGKIRIVREPEIAREHPLALLPLQPRRSHDRGLVIHARNAVEQIVRLPVHDQGLLLFQQGEHLAVLFELFPQRLN